MVPCHGVGPLREKASLRQASIVLGYLFTQLCWEGRTLAASHLLSSDTSADATPEGSFLPFYYCFRKADSGS